MIVYGYMEILIYLILFLIAVPVIGVGFIALTTYLEDLEQD